jgi:hypothetical protein
MRDTTNEILELIRRKSSSLPKDMEDRLKASIEDESFQKVLDDLLARPY